VQDLLCGELAEVLLWGADQVLPFW
jgi:hypothetical protein